MPDLPQLISESRMVSEPLSTSTVKIPPLISEFLTVTLDARIVRPPVICIESTMAPAVETTIPPEWRVRLVPAGTPVLEASG